MMRKNLLRVKAGLFLLMRKYQNTTEIAASVMALTMIRLGFLRVVFPTGVPPFDPPPSYFKKNLFNIKLYAIVKQSI